MKRKEEVKKALEEAKDPYVAKALMPNARKLFAESLLQLEANRM